MNRITEYNKETRVDENGEILSEEIVVKEHFIKKAAVKREEFMQVYIEDNKGLFELSTGTEIKLMYLIWKEVEFYKDTDEGNKIYLVKHLKDKWAEAIGVSLGAINNAITSITKKGLLLKGDGTSLYYLNPNYFFKGALKDRPKVIRILTEYEIKD